MGTKLQRVVSTGPTLPVRQSDASQDRFVRKHMTDGESLVFARKYTQSAALCVAQIAMVSVPAIILSGVVGGLIIGGVTAAVLGFEVTNRVAVTEGNLVVQTSVLVARFDRSRISNLRVETLGMRQWGRFDAHLVDTTYFLRKGPGLRFQYTKPNGKVSQVFVGIEDADRLLAQLR
jgi:hypothetical protein